MPVPVPQQPSQAPLCQLVQPLRHRTQPPSSMAQEQERLTKGGTAAVDYHYRECTMSSKSPAARLTPSPPHVAPSRGGSGPAKWRIRFPRNRCSVQWAIWRPLTTRCLVHAVSPLRAAFTALSPYRHWYIYMHYLALAVAVAASPTVSPCAPAFKRPFPCAPSTCHPAPADITSTGRPSVQP